MLGIENVMELNLYTETAKCCISTACRRREIRTHGAKFASMSWQRLPIDTSVISKQDHLYRFQSVAGEPLLTSVLQNDLSQERTGEEIRINICSGTSCI